MSLPVVLAAPAAIPLAVVQSSFVGWGFHRYWLHRPWLPKGAFTSQTLLHQVRMDRNLNVLLPLADAVLGTLVLQAESPAITPDVARRLARRHSAYGRRLNAARK